MEGENKGPRLKRCDLAECEARCCYDGVYLRDDDITRISSAVNDNAGFFDFLPEQFIVDGEWKDVRGRKTAVKLHYYQSPDFPDHFEQTRCVFAVDSGECSLQMLAHENGEHPWTHKPKSCWLHPITLQDDLPVAPPAARHQDPHDFGDEYPGYVIFTPCGQDRDDGEPWEITLREELDYLDNDRTA